MYMCLQNHFISTFGSFQTLLNHLALPLTSESVFEFSTLEMKSNKACLIFVSIITLNVNTTLKNGHDSYNVNIYQYSSSKLIIM